LIVNGGVVAAVIVSDTVFVEVDAVKLASAGVNAALIRGVRADRERNRCGAARRGQCDRAQVRIAGRAQHDRSGRGTGQPDSASVAAVPCSTVADAPPFTLIVNTVGATIAALMLGVVAPR